MLGGYGTDDATRRDGEISNLKPLENGTCWEMLPATMTHCREGASVAAVAGGMIIVGCGNYSKHGFYDGEMYDEGSKQHPCCNVMIGGTR